MVNDGKLLLDGSLTFIWLAMMVDHDRSRLAIDFFCLMMVGLDC